MAEGYKDWSAGDILTAADLEDYTVKQSVMVFADSSARNTALSGVLRQGMVAYLKNVDRFTTYDGSSWVVTGNAGTTSYRLVQTIYFTSSGTFTKASYPWLRALKVTAVGAGGGGGGCGATGAGEASAGAGGSGGGLAIKFVTDIAGLAASETVTIGAGGTGVVNGNGGNGGTTSALGAESTGGNGSSYVGVALTMRTREPGFRGSGTTGDFTIPGSFGDVAVRQPGGASVGGAGGAGPLGNGGGRARALAGTSGSLAGINGFGYGAGGSGAVAEENGAAQAGGNGSDGIVIVELYA